MEAKELRIGNLLNHNNGFVVGSFTVNITHILDLEEEDDYAKEYEPIPLTEEWLIKFGFEWDDIVTKTTGETEKMLYKNILLMQRHHETNWVAAPYGYPLSIHRTIYVHQLQNLYFALTGEELGLQST